MSVLARAVREVEAGAQRGRVSPSTRTKFQVVALLAREERTRAKADASLTDAQRAEKLKRLDGIGTILAQTAARDTSLLSLLAEDAEVSDAAIVLKHDMLRAAGVEETPEAEAATEDEPVAAPPERRVVPQSVVARQLANPFLTPDFESAQSAKPQTQRLSTWELLGPAVLGVRAGRRRIQGVHGPSRAVGHQGPGRPRADAPPGGGHRRG